MSSGTEGVTQSEVRRRQGSQAQGYILRAEAGREVPGYANPASAWAAMPPWVELSSYRSGERPALLVYEAEITPWDELSADGVEGSRWSRLEGGAIVGLELVVVDFDPQDVSDGRRAATVYALGGNLLYGTTSDAFVDAELVPRHVSDCSGASDTAVPRRLVGAGEGGLPLMRARAPTAQLRRRAPTEQPCPVAPLHSTFAPELAGSYSRVE